MARSRKDSFKIQAFTSIEGLTPVPFELESKLEEVYLRYLQMVRITCEIFSETEIESDREKYSYLLPPETLDSPVFHNASCLEYMHIVSGINRKYCAAYLYKVFLEELAIDILLVTEREKREIIENEYYELLRLSQEANNINFIKRIKTELKDVQVRFKKSIKNIISNSDRVFELSSVNQKSAFAIAKKIREIDEILQKQLKHYTNQNTFKVGYKLVMISEYMGQKLFFKWLLNLDFSLALDLRRLMLVVIILQDISDKALDNIKVPLQQVAVMPFPIRKEVIALAESEKIVDLIQFEAIKQKYKN